MTRTSFSRWFRGSKIRHADGSPLVVFHGTRTSFTEWNPDLAGRGYWFAESPEDASDYAHDVFPGFAAAPGADAPMVIPAFLRMRKPFDTAIPARVRLIRRINRAAGVNLWPHIRRGMTQGGVRAALAYEVLGAHPEALRVLRSLGYDGFIEHGSNVARYGRAFIVFSPDQIRFAIGARRPQVA